MSAKAKELMFRAPVFRAEFRWWPFSRPSRSLCALDGRFDMDQTQPPPRSVEVQKKLKPTAPAEIPHFIAEQPEPMSGHSYLPIDTRRGTKVILSNPEHGYFDDRNRLARLGIAKGKVCTVARLHVHSYHTDLYLEEFPGETFNSVNWGLAR